MPERCRRHPDRCGDFVVAMHFLAGGGVDWRHLLHIDQTYGPFCDECRLEFNRWATTVAT